jgi:fucose permease
VSEGPLRREALNAAACGAMSAFGIVMALLGATLTSLAQDLGVTLTGAGVFYIWMNGAMLVSSLALGRLMDRAGLKLPLTAGALLVAAALLLLIGARAASDLPLAALCLGLGGSALNGGSNTLVADLWDDPAAKASRLNTLGLFFGIGALLLPLLGSFRADSLGWRVSLGIAAGVCVALALAAIALRFPPAKIRTASPGPSPLSFLREPPVLLLGAMLCLESANEFTLGGFITSLLTREKGFDAGRASMALTGFWAAVMAGRVAVSRLVLKYERTRVLAGCAALASFAVLAAASVDGAEAAAAVVLLGAAAAGVYPTALGLAGARYPAASGTVFGLLFTMALCGGMTMPYAVGRVAEASSLSNALLLPAAAFAVIALLAFPLRRALARS